MDPYILLPFRHARLGDPNLLLVNECGQFHFISSYDFERLISHSLEKDEPLFLDLKSQHFLTDTDVELPIKLLATKYRTKKGFLRDFTSLHMMVITLRCNHRCEYCQVSSEESGAYKWDMGARNYKNVQGPAMHADIKYDLNYFREITVTITTFYYECML